MAHLRQRLGIHVVGDNVAIVCARTYRVPQKKTSFSENWAWQILLLIMRNPPSFFLKMHVIHLWFIYLLSGWVTYWTIAK